jgi:hypothetical protein
MTAPARFKLPDTTRRDALFAALLALVILGLVAYAVMHVSDGVVGNSLTGRITAKRFTPQPEEQVTIGTRGVHAEKIDGEYCFEVEANGRPYTVWVDASTYAAKRVGDSFVFPPPKP